MEYDYLFENDTDSNVDSDSDDNPSDIYSDNDEIYKIENLPENVNEDDCVKLITINNGMSSNTRNIDKDDISYKEMGKIISELTKYLSYKDQIKIHYLYSLNIDIIKKKLKNKIILPCGIYVNLCNYNNIRFSKKSLKYIFEIKINEIYFFRYISMLDNILNFEIKKNQNLKFKDHVFNYTNGWIIVIKSFIVNYGRNMEIENMFSNKDIDKNLKTIDIFKKDNYINQIFLLDNEIFRYLINLLNISVLKIILWNANKKEFIIPRHFPINKLVDHSIFIVFYLLLIYFIQLKKISKKINPINKININYPSEIFYLFFDKIILEKLSEYDIIFIIILLLIKKEIKIYNNKKINFINNLLTEINSKININ